MERQILQGKWGWIGNTPKEASQQHHMSGTDLEPAGEEEERSASQQLEARHGGADKTTGVQLGNSSNNSQGPDRIAENH